MSSANQAYYQTRMSEIQDMIACYGYENCHGQFGYHTELWNPEHTFCAYISLVDALLRCQQYLKLNVLEFLKGSQDQSSKLAVLVNDWLFDKHLLGEITSFMSLY